MYPLSWRSMRLVAASLKIQKKKLGFLTQYANRYLHTAYIYILPLFASQKLLNWNERPLQRGLPAMVTWCTSRRYISYDSQNPMSQTANLCWFFHRPMDRRLGFITASRISMISDLEIQEVMVRLGRRWSKHALAPLGLLCWGIAPRYKS